MSYHSLILDDLAITAAEQSGRLTLQEFNPEDPKQLWEVTSLLPLIETKDDSKGVFDVSLAIYAAGTLVLSYSKNKDANQNFAWTEDGKRIFPVKAPKLFVTRSATNVVLFPLDPKDTSQVITKIPEGYYVKNLITNTTKAAVKVSISVINKVVEIPAGVKDKPVFSPVNVIYSFADSTADLVFDREEKTAQNAGAGTKITISVPRTTKVILKAQAGSSPNKPNEAVLTWKTDDGSNLASYDIVQKEPLPSKLLQNVKGDVSSFTLEVEANIEYRFYVEGTSSKDQKFRSELERVFVKGLFELEHKESTVDTIAIDWRNLEASFFFVSFSVVMNGIVIAKDLPAGTSSFTATKAHGVDQQEKNTFIVEGKTKSGKIIQSNSVEASLIKKPRETKVILELQAGGTPNEVVLHWKTDDGSEFDSYDIIQKEPEKVLQTVQGNVFTFSVEVEANVEYVFVIEGTSAKDGKVSSEPQKILAKGALELEHKESTGESITIDWKNTGASFFFESFTVKMNRKVIAKDLPSTTSSFKATEGVDEEDENKFVVEGKTKSDKIIISNTITAALGFSRITPIVGTTGGMK